jgi:hypothetical protein
MSHREPQTRGYWEKLQRETVNQLMWALRGNDPINGGSITYILQLIRVTYRMIDGRRPVDEIDTCIPAIERDNGFMDVGERQLLMLALTRFLSTQSDRRFEGTMSDLLRHLNAVLPKDLTGSPSWPTSPDSLGIRLRRITPDLNAQGWLVGTKRGATRLLVIVGPPGTARL